MADLPANPSPEELEDIRRIGRINGFLPDIKALMDKRVDVALTVADGKIERHEMTPEEAFSVLHEIHAYRKVLKSLTSQSKMIPSKVG